MTEKPPKKSGTANELDLIKSALSANLDETTVDIFKEDLFSTAVKKTEEQEKPAQSGPRAEDAEEIKMPSAKTSAQAQKPEKRISEKPGPVSALQPAPEKPSKVKSQPSPPKTGTGMELKVEAGEFHSVPAVKDEDKTEATAELLMKLEKMGDDFLSADEMKKLFSNVNLLIELLQKALSRLDQIERKLKEKGLL